MLMIIAYTSQNKYVLALFIQRVYVIILTVLNQERVIKMSLFIGSMKLRIPGRKELTDHKDIIELKDIKLLYIPLINGGSTTFDVLVKKGDKVKIGSLLAKRNDTMEVPLFSSVSGVVKEIKPRIHASGREVDHIVIENDFKYEMNAPLKPLDVNTASREELVAFTKQAGIVGCGGAGFPTYIKYQSANNVDAILINGVECEPYITADYAMMNEKLEFLAIGVQAMIKMAGAKKAVIAIKKTKAELIAKVEEAIADYREIELVAVPDVYPMGWERTVVYQVFQKRYDRLPGEVGIIVNNSTTAIQLGLALCTGMPIIEKIITVSGDESITPANVKVPVGTPVEFIINALGGYHAEDVLLIAGGPMMGKAQESEDFVVHAYLNSITVLKNKDEKEVACLRCGRCSESCPAGLQPVRINQFVKTEDIDTLNKLACNRCIECGLCTYVCPSKLLVTEGIRKAKRLLATQKS